METIRLEYILRQRQNQVLARLLGDTNIVHDEEVMKNLKYQGRKEMQTASLPSLMMGVISETIGLNDILENHGYNNMPKSITTNFVGFTFPDDVLTINKSHPLDGILNLMVQDDIVTQIDAEYTEHMTISPGVSIKDREMIISPSKVYAFGTLFNNPHAMDTMSQLYLIASRSGVINDAILHSTDDVPFKEEIMASKVFPCYDEHSLNLFEAFYHTPIGSPVKLNASITENGRRGMIAVVNAYDATSGNQLYSSENKLNVMSAPLFVRAVQASYQGRN